MAEGNSETPPESLITQFSPLENPAKESVSIHTSGNVASTSSKTCNTYSFRKFNVTPDILNRSLNITLKFLSPSASSGPFCRICHEGDNLEDLVSLCKCTGTVGLVHLTCMERWLSIRKAGGGKHDKCEICNFTFETACSPRPITEWYQSDEGSVSNRRSILGDAACFSMITPLTGLSGFLCFEGARQHVIWNNSLEAGCLIALATFLVTVYLVWNFLTIRYHLNNYLKWRSINQNVRLVGYRRKSSIRDQASHQPDMRARESTENGDSFTTLVTNREQTPALLVQSSSSSDVVNEAQASNVCLNVTYHR